MSFPSVDRTILSAKDKKNLAGAQELAALLTELDIQRHKVQHALKDLAEYLPKCDSGIIELVQSVVDKYNNDFDLVGYRITVTEGGSCNSLVVSVRKGDERIVRLNYSVVEPGVTVHSRSMVCEVKCLVQYDDRVQTFTFYLLQDLVDHLESVLLRSGSVRG